MNIFEHNFKSKSDSSKKQFNNQFLKFKIKKDGPYEFVLEEIGDKILITAILEGGIIFKHGGLKVGDELFDINGIRLKGCSILNCVDILEMEISNKNKNFIELSIFRENSVSQKEMNFEKSKSPVNEQELDEEVTSL
ncbi:hypothetical protein BpHYR1_024812 [Brachionus plicatilis]|uniref:PDZ domain-containing protein n=1 Tax=Brachionus plicatilis TaxID=10195 RepID=A0A3M7PNQ0_BRAPC|nr:hypothetical protein BpHYR1_024812 [Brachionus plicatilis]